MWQWMVMVWDVCRVVNWGIQVGGAGGCTTLLLLRWSLCGIAIALDRELVVIGDADNLAGRYSGTTADRALCTRETSQELAVLVVRHEHLQLHCT